MELHSRTSHRFDGDHAETGANISKGNNFLTTNLPHTRIRLWKILLLLGFGAVLAIIVIVVAVEVVQHPSGSKAQYAHPELGSSSGTDPASQQYGHSQWISARLSFAHWHGYLAMGHLDAFHLLNILKLFHSGFGLGNSSHLRHIDQRACDPFVQPDSQSAMHMGLSRCDLLQSQRLSRSVPLRCYSEYLRVRICYQHSDGVRVPFKDIYVCSAHEQWHCCLRKVDDVDLVSGPGPKWLPRIFRHPKDELNPTHLSGAKLLQDTCKVLSLQRS